VWIKGNLTIPEDCHALVIFSHGSGSSRFSVRNRFVAGYLNKHHIATLLADLLTPEEDHEYRNRFNIELLTERLVRVTSYAHSLPELSACSIGLFGASTGAASALKASVKMGDLISAVVSRGGRPDLAAQSLDKVKAPVLLIVGSLDTDVIILNKKALTLLKGEKQIVIVEGASHLFEETGKLDEVARLANDWFVKHLINNVVLN
jgi:putative phosphoribosyl transferase